METTGFAEMGAIELRKAAQNFGIKNVAKYRKPELLALVLAAVAEEDAKAEAIKQIEAKAAEFAEGEDDEAGVSPESLAIEAEHADLAEAAMAEIAGLKPAQAKATKAAKKAPKAKASKAKALAEAEAEAAALAEVKKVIETPKKGRCSICGTRPAGGADAKLAGHKDYCDECLHEAEWENEHEDDAHDAVTEGTFKPKGGQGKLIRERMEVCWICKPELNKAAKPYAERTGTSRKGMVMTVPVHGRAGDKAKIVIEAAQNHQGVDVKSRQREGRVEVTISGSFGTMVLAWDKTSGAYAYEFSSIKQNGKKERTVRNIAAALRIINS